MVLMQLELAGLISAERVAATVGAGRADEAQA